MKKKGVIYLLCDSNTEKVYKIGVTRGSLDKRIKKLQTGNCGEIYVADYYESEIPFYIEKCLHRRYFPKQVLNEWYQLDLEEVLAFKQTCKEYEEIAESLKDNPFFKFDKLK